MLFVLPKLETSLGIVQCTCKILDTEIVGTLTRNGYSPVYVSRDKLGEFLEGCALSDGVIAYQSRPTPDNSQHTTGSVDLERKLFDAFVVLKAGEDPIHYEASFTESYLSKLDERSCWAAGTYFLLTKTNLRV
jgi:hypothetical protein